MTQYFIQTKSGPRGPFAASVIAEGVHSGRIPANASIEDVETGFKLRAGDIAVGVDVPAVEPASSEPQPAAAAAPAEPAAPPATAEASPVPPTAAEAPQEQSSGFQAAPWEAGTRPPVTGQRRAATYPQPRGASPHAQAGYPQVAYPQQQAAYAQQYAQPGAYAQTAYPQQYPQAGYPYPQQTAYPQQPAYPQQYGQSGYAAPYGYAAASPYPAPRSTSGMAIAALVVALAGFATCPLIGIVSVILGFTALKECEPAGPKTGRGMAIAGIVIGGLETLGTVIVFLAVMATSP